jgi:hypothetical protein
MKELSTFAVLTLVIGFLWYDNNEIEKQVKELQMQNDTLHSDLYQCQLEIGKYAFAIDHFSKTNPKAAKEFNDYYEKEAK